MGTAYLSLGKPEPSSLPDPLPLNDVLAHSRLSPWGWDADTGEKGLNTSTIKVDEHPHLCLSQKAQESDKWKCCLKHWAKCESRWELIRDAWEKMKPSPKRRVLFLDI